MQTLNLTQHLRPRTVFMAALSLALIPAPGNLHAGITTTGDITPDPNATTSSDNLSIGFTTVGTMTVDNGSDVDSSQGVIGYYVNGQGRTTITGVGSTWTNSGYLHVGLYGTGELKIQGPKKGRRTFDWSGLGCHITAAGSYVRVVLDMFVEVCTQLAKASCVAPDYLAIALLHGVAD